MGALGADTAVGTVGADPGSYRARLVQDWATWGPNGGYLASIALRAAGAASALPRPATFSCLFLGVGSFDDVDIEVTTLRPAKRTEALRVHMTQGDRALLEAHVWAVDDGLAGLEHDVTEAPVVPDPGSLPTLDTHVHEFWDNFERKPVSDRAVAAPEVREWLRFVPEARFDGDPWLDACRSVVLLDTFQWPAAHQAHVARGPDDAAFVAPNIDLSIRFHTAAPSSEWLLVDARSPVAAGGLMACDAQVWSEERTLVASAASHLLCREVPRGTPGSGT